MTCKFVLALAMLVALATTEAQAHNHAHPVSIEGNWLVAILIAVAGIAALIILVRAVLYVDRRDAWLRRGAKDDFWIRD